MRPSSHSLTDLTSIPPTLDNLMSSKLRYGYALKAGIRGWAALRSLHRRSMVWSTWRSRPSSPLEGTNYILEEISRIRPVDSSACVCGNFTQTDDPMMVE